MSLHIQRNHLQQNGMNTSKLFTAFHDKLFDSDIDNTRLAIDVNIESNMVAQMIESTVDSSSLDRCYMLALHVTLKESTNQQSVVIAKV